MASGVRLSPARAWLALCALLALGALVGMLLPSSALDWQPSRAPQEPWRWWSAAFVHWTPRHLAANLAGVLVLAVFGLAAAVPWSAVRAWLLAWPLTHLALTVEPALVHYGGLSGVLHAGVAAAAWPLVRHGRGVRRALGAAVLAGLAVKVLAERPWAGATVAMPEWDFPVAPLAHAAGALAGLACAVLADRLSPPQPAPPA